jgi:hypothetical protein
LHEGQTIRGELYRKRRIARQEWLCHFWSAPASTRFGFLPLPLGEGWGEGAKHSASQPSPLHPPSHRERRNHFAALPPHTAVSLRLTVAFFYEFAATPPLPRRSLELIQRQRR